MGFSFSMALALGVLFAIIGVPLSLLEQRRGARKQPRQRELPFREKRPAHG